jgi:hypothetical protein
MAIIRCPYCHAIIDETAKYCNNCGTQLLFPEDETLEEEIPGEKIVDADVEEKDYELDEPEDETVNLEDADNEEESWEEDADEGVELADESDEELKGRETGETEIGEPGEEDVKTEDLDEKTAERRVEGTDEDDRDAERGELAEGETGEPEDAEIRTAVLGEEPGKEPEENREETGEEQEPAAAEELAPEEEAEEKKEPVGTGAVEEAELVTEDFVEKVPSDEEPEEREEIPEESEDEPLPAGADLDKAEVEYVTDSRDAGEPGSAGESPEEAPPEDETATVEVAVKRADTFDTRELDKLGRTVDLGKEKVDRFLEVMAEKEEEAREEDESRSRPRSPEKADTGGTLPPWADAMVGAPSFEAKDKTDSFPPGWEEKDLGDVEPPVEEPGVDEEPAEKKAESILPRRRASDSGIGYPERLTQPVLPFGGKPEEEEEGEETLPGGRERVLPRRRRRGGKEFLRPGIGEGEEERERPPFNLTDFLKAKAFDGLFLAIAWLVTSWFAARSLGTTLFRLFASAGGLLLALYLTLLLMYFFLFQFFLGETLGDRIFRRKG